MKGRIQKRGNQSTKLLKHLGKKQKVSVGHFEDGSRHHSGYTFPELMQLHHVGTGEGKGEIPARPVLSILAYRVDQNPRKVFTGIKAIFKSNQYTQSVEVYLKKVGARLKTMERSIFGDSSVLTPNKPLTLSHKQGRNTPLVDTKSLRDNIKVRFKK